MEKDRQGRFEEDLLGKIISQSKGVSPERILLDGFRSQDYNSSGFCDFSGFRRIIENRFGLLNLPSGKLRAVFDSYSSNGRIDYRIFVAEVLRAGGNSKANLLSDIESKIRSTFHRDSFYGISKAFCEFSRILSRKPLPSVPEFRRESEKLGVRISEQEALEILKHDDKEFLLRHFFISDLVREKSLEIRKILNLLSPTELVRSFSSKLLTSVIEGRLSSSGMEREFSQAYEIFFRQFSINTVNCERFLMLMCSCFRELEDSNIFFSECFRSSGTQRSRSGSIEPGGPFALLGSASLSMGRLGFYQLFRELGKMGRNGEVSLPQLRLALKSINARTPETLAASLFTAMGSNHLMSLRELQAKVVPKVADPQRKEFLTACERLLANQPAGKASAFLEALESSGAIDALGPGVSAQASSSLRVWLNEFIETVAGGWSRTRADDLLRFFELIAGSLRDNERMNVASRICRLLREGEEKKKESGRGDTYSQMLRARLAEKELSLARSDRASSPPTSFAATLYTPANEQLGDIRRQLQVNASKPGVPRTAFELGLARLQKLLISTADIAIPLRLEATIRQSADNHGLIDFDSFALAVEKSLPRQNLPQTDDLTCVFGFPDSNPLAKVRSLLSTIRGQLSRPREAAVLDLFDRLAPSKILPLGALRKSFLAKEARAFFVQASTSELQQSWDEALKLFFSLNFGKNDQAKLECRDFLSLFDNLSMFFESDLTFKNFCASSFK